MRFETTNTQQPESALMIWILKRAVMDAKLGNLAALAFLVASGADYAEALTTGSRDMVLSFCSDIALQHDTAKLERAWKI